MINPNVCVAWRNNRESRRRRQLAAKQAVTEKAISIRLACETYGIRATGYRYQARLNDENAVIADWLRSGLSCGVNFGVNCKWGGEMNQSNEYAISERRGCMPLWRHRWRPTPTS